MDSLKEQYEKILAERETIARQISELENNDVVKKYLDLRNKNEQSAKQQENLYEQMKIEEYSSCNHIWVIAAHDYDSWEHRSYDYNGCIKCGLDQRVLGLIERGAHKEWLSLEHQVMYDAMLMYDDSYRRRGIDTKVVCDLDLAKSVYSKIKKEHPDIDDETAVEYFEIAIDDIRKNIIIRF